MNIMLLIDVLPTSNSGMTIRIERIFNKLSENHKIHFVYIGNSEIKEEHLQIVKHFSASISKIPLNYKQCFYGRILNILLLKHGHCAEFRFKEDYAMVRKKLRKFIVENKIDVVHVFGCFTAQYVKGFLEVFRIWDIADSYSLDIKRKIKMSSLISKISLWLCKIRLFNFEKEIIDNFTRTIFVSSIDASEYGRLKSKNKIRIIPNGVDLKYFKKNEENKEDPNALIFTGHMSFLPNIDAVKYFVSKIYFLIKKEKPNVKFFVVGADASNEIIALNNKDNIIVTGRVDDIRIYLDKGVVFVNPMITGCGIKNKVLQAMAMKKAIVSTTLGAESISVSNGRDIVLADKPEEFAAKVIELMDDDDFRKHLSDEARKTVENNYGWEKTLLVYEQMYNSLGVN